MLDMVPGEIGQDMTPATDVPHAGSSSTERVPLQADAQPRVDVPNGSDGTGSTISAMTDPLVAEPHPPISAISQINKGETNQETHDLRVVNEQGGHNVDVHLPAHHGCIHDPDQMSEVDGKSAADETNDMHDWAESGHRQGRIWHGGKAWK